MDDDFQCCVCNGVCGNAHVCMICKKPVHTFHGKCKEEDEGYGGRITCNNCFVGADDDLNNDNDEEVSIVHEATTKDFGTIDQFQGLYLFLHCLYLLCLCYNWPKAKLIF